MSDPVAVTYRIDGPEGAPVLVLSNSLGTSWSLWDGEASELSRRFRLVRYDKRGHGRSPVPPGPYGVPDLGADLIHLLDRLNIARAHLCGMSLGGMLSLWVAAHAPSRVDRLVVFSASPQLGAPSGWTERAARVRAEGLPSMAEQIVARWITPTFRAAHPEVFQRLRDMLCATPAAGYAACCEAIGAMNLTADLRLVRAPTLAVAGAEDPAAPPEHARRVVEGIAGARMEVVAGAAHLVNLEQSRRVIDLLVEHLAPARGDPEATR